MRVFSPISRTCEGRSALVLFLIVSCCVARAQPWDGGGSNDNWGTAANWYPNGKPANDGTANIVLAGAIRTSPVVDEAWDIRSLTFDAGALAFDLSGQTLGIRVSVDNNSSVTQIVHNRISSNFAQTWRAGSAPLLFTGSIDATQLVFTGPFGTTLSGAAVVNGSITVNGGTLSLTGSDGNLIQHTTVNGGTLVLAKSLASMSASALGGDLVIGDGIRDISQPDTVRLMVANQLRASSGTMRVNSSGLFDLNGFDDQVDSVQLAGGDVATGIGALTSSLVGSLGSARTASISGNVNLPGTVLFDVADGLALTDLDVSASLSNGGVYKTGTGVMMMSGSAANTHSGTTKVEEGTLVLAKSASNGAIRADLEVGPGGFLLANSTVRYEANDQIFATIGNLVTVFGRLGLVGDTLRGTLDLNGHTDNIHDLILQGGAVTTGSGTLSVAGNVTSKAANVTGLISGNLGLLGGTVNFDIEDGPLDIDDVQVSAVISNGSLTKSGAGRLVLGGTSANTYTGATTVNAGTLLLNKPPEVAAIAGNLVVGDGAGAAKSDIVRLAASEQIDASASTHTITVNNSGLLDLNGFDESIRNLTLVGGFLDTSGGVLTLNGTLTASSPITSTVTGKISLGGGPRDVNVTNGPVAIDLDIPAVISDGGIAMRGPGTLRLSAANTFASGFLLQQGTVVVANDSALGTGIVNLALAATLRTTGSERALANPVNATADATIDTPIDLNLSGPFSIYAGATLTKTGASPLVIDGAQSHGALAKLNINAGAVHLNTNAGSPAAANLAIALNGAGSIVTFGSSQNLRSLSVGAGTTASLDAGGSKALVAKSLTIAPPDGAIPKAGKLDLNEHALVVDYDGVVSPLADVRAAIINGYGPAATSHWAAEWITSSAAAADASRFAVGYGEASDVLGLSGAATGTFAGQSVDATAVLARYTLIADADLSGAVGFTDLVRLAQHYGSAGGTELWSHGDFTFDGNVDFNDLVKLAQNYGTALPAVFAAAVPEPGASGIALAGLVGWRLGRRRSASKTSVNPATEGSGMALNSTR